jgi:dimeric dUTPase (all-alpha-NTP-PPase superfamily)
MHFYLSFGITLGMSNDIEPIIADDDLTLQFLAIYDSISKFSNKSTLDNFNNSFGLFIGLGKLLNYTDEDMKNAYLRKNEINFERIKNKY